MTEKAGNAISVGNNRACSNGGGGENECGNVTSSTEREEVTQRNPYVMEIDKGRNCYTYRRFGHMAQHCRYRGRELELKIAED